MVERVKGKVKKSSRVEEELWRWKKSYVGGSCIVLTQSLPWPKLLFAFLGQILPVEGVKLFKSGNKFSFIMARFEDIIWDENKKDCK